MIGLLSFLFGDNIAERAARYTFLMRKYKKWREEDDACELPELPRRDKELAKKDARYCYWASIESPTARLAIYSAARTESGKIRLITGPNGARYEVEKEEHEISEREFRLLKKRLKEMTDEYWAELIDGTTFKGATFFVYLYQIDIEFAEAICEKSKVKESIWARIKRPCAKRWKTPRNLSRRDKRDSR